MRRSGAAPWPSWPSGQRRRCTGRDHAGGRGRSAGAGRGRRRRCWRPQSPAREGRGRPVRKDAIAAVASLEPACQERGLRGRHRRPAWPGSRTAATPGLPAAPGSADHAPTSRHILAAPAWPYANGPRHIGHVSGFGVPCDMFSRYQRMAGNKVLMVSGTDEHGTPIQVQADAEGVTARELADRYNRVIAEDLQGSACPTTCSPGPRRATTTRWSRRSSSACYENGYIFPQDHARRDLARRPAAPCPTATSRAPARSAATTARAATSATTAATSSTRST